jgi:capsid protein
VEILPPGKTIEMAVPPGAGVFVQTEREYLYSVAAAYEVPFWAMTGILSEVNFSSMRGDWLEFNRRLSHLRWNVTIPQLCAPICRWHDEAAKMAQLLKAPMRWTHTPPRREMIQPKEEIPALILAMQAGMMSLQEVQRSYGWIPRQVLEELAADKQMAEELGLNLSVFLPDAVSPAPALPASGENPPL